MSTSSGKGNKSGKEKEKEKVSDDSLKSIDKDELANGFFFLFYVSRRSQR